MTALPPIKITDRRRLQQRLEALLESPAVARLPVAGALAEELARATVVPAADMPADVVTMGSQVICVEETTGIEHRLVLSWPAQADPASSHVSVLAPVGSALLGLSVGQVIDWAGPAGKPLRVRVTGVTAQP